ncbi:uncharacterized protein LOC135164542 [Diachasmimorpha longicaudata]|uniref:uncharacterized protein LOC135164542 n=1 Tax=Diachasmimorpha longicaudata TaxID=58733 RepID=UPI0030B88041
MKIPPKLSGDLEWLAKNLDYAKNKINDFNPIIEIFTHASLTGWGVFCNEKRAHGHWSKEEKQIHINYLELQAVSFGLKCFAINLRDCDVLLRADNTSAIAYLNKRGGVRSPKLAKIAKDIWRWCEARNIWTFANYICSNENLEAAFESRQLEPGTEYALSEKAFQIIVLRFGKPEVDLFASRTNEKCRKYLSWESDPGAMEIDAFTISWNEYFFYAEATPIVAEDYPGCRNYIRQAYSLKKVPVESADVMISSLTESTIKYYNTELKKWWQFCSETRVNPYETSVTLLLECLTKLYKKGPSYGTLNCRRSAVTLLDESDVGSDQKIKRFLKGVSNERPPKPRYDETWDPKIVLDFIQKLGSNTDLTLKSLSKKLVTLLALVTGHRIQTLTFIDIRNFSKENNIYEIKIPQMIKTSRFDRQKPQPILIIPFFEGNPMLCLAVALEAYLQKTKPTPINEHKLFVSYKKPHVAVGIQTLSR